ncbi:PH domain-containing protein [Terracoccus luteus]|uniref:YdbS-like PH domain-containing protein n=1 Tax=Terracoccus luteus TaxID=53356 RepID=A0A839PQE8_9MICO|nr:PH domain-containing protein [Terracoccus luteus]MBB2986420.1 hypothetical protein [Terracoccus luteus]MCP2171991.1 hypothetical protein [Terracoccus luteus]
MAGRRQVDEVPAGLGPILLPGENLVVAVHMHWAKLTEPVLSTAAALVVALVVDANVTQSTQVIGTVFWWGFLAVVVRLLWVLTDWYHNWFVATDKRLLLRYGLITHKVAMMPLSKVTDMSYERSIVGQLVGFGRFVMESAGQDQALRVVNWVPDPDRTYRLICAEIFHIVPPPLDLADDLDDVDDLDDRDVVAPPRRGRGDDDGRGGRRGGDAGPDGGDGDDDGDDGGVDAGWRGDASPSRPATGPVSRPTASAPYAEHRDPLADAWHDEQPGYPDVPPVHNPLQDRLDSYSRAVPVQRREEGESIYESEDLRRRRRGADTGPLPITERDQW